MEREEGSIYIQIMCMHTHVNICAFEDTHTCTFTCTLTNTHTRSHNHLDKHTHRRTHNKLSVYVYASVYICMDRFTCTHPCTRVVVVSLHTPRCPNHY